MLFCVVDARKDHKPSEQISNMPELSVKAYVARLVAKVKSAIHLDHDGMDPRVTIQEGHRHERAGIGPVQLDCEAGLHALIFYRSDESRGRVETVSAKADVRAWPALVEITR